LGLAEIGAKNVETILAHRLRRRETRKLLGCPVKEGVDPTASVYDKNAVSDTVENNATSRSIVPTRAGLSHQGGKAGNGIFSHLPHPFSILYAVRPFASASALEDQYDRLQTMGWNPGPHFALRVFPV